MYDNNLYNNKGVGNTYRPRCDMCLFNKRRAIPYPTLHWSGNSSKRLLPVISFTNA